MNFSQIEKEDLLKAWIAISFAFAIFHVQLNSPEFIMTFIISLITVGMAFLLHELAHKYVAQRYGCWAEFRADDKMLVIMVLLAFFSPVLFAAPGAVYIIGGHINKEKNGKISLAGPAINIVLALVFFALLFFIQLEGIFFDAVFYGFQINSFIALFNMIPFGNFDGEKILRWNKIIYVATVFFSGILVVIPQFI